MPHTFDIAEPSSLGPSPASRPARLLAPTPPAFSRSRLGETSRAAPADREAGDELGGGSGSGAMIDPNLAVPNFAVVS